MVSEGETYSTADKPSTSEERQLVSDKQREEATSLRYSANCVLVNERQRGNPLLCHIRNVPYQFCDSKTMKPDYVMGQKCCALFLSLRYHQRDAEYIHKRMAHLGKDFELRLLLVFVDTKDSQYLLRQLAKICINAGYTLMIGWTYDDVAHYVETYKSLEHKPPDALMSKCEYKSDADRLIELLSTIKGVNRLDASNLVETFGCLAKITEATEEQLALVPGFGLTKAKRLHSALRQPFKAAHKSIA